MDSDKDKPQNPPTPDHSETKTDDDNKNNDKDNNNNDNYNNKSDDENHSDEKPDRDQDLPQDHGDNSPTAPKPSSSNDDEETKPEILPDSEIKDEQDTAEVALEETPPPALDLEKICEEVDQYILALSNARQGDDESVTPPPDVPIFLEQFIILVEAKVADYDSSESPVKWSRLTEEDSASFLEAVMRLFSISKSLSEFAADFKYAHTINRIGGVLQRAMAYLEEEFRSLLEEYKIQDPPSQSSNGNGNETKPDPEPEQQENPPPESESELEPAAPKEEKENTFPGYSEEILSDLIKLAKVMMKGGHEAEASQVYFVARRNASEESLHKLGFEKHSIDDVQKMQWESLEREIMTWIRIFTQWATVHFSAERRLSDVVFSDHPSVSETLFCSLSQAVILQLLNFARAVALTKRAAEKLFKFLDVYQTLRDTLPTIEGLFPEEWMNEVKTEVSMIKGRLGEAVISIFVELEASIKADAAKTPVPGGAVHPLTRYTMNYLKYVCDYKDTLEQIFREHQKIERADSATGSDFNYNAQAAQSNSGNSETVKQSPFQAQIVKVMELVDANLDAKSKLYKDHALSSIFMMNNGRYILQKVRGSPEINSLMGDSWSRKRSTELRQYHKGYQRETWGKLLHCLHPEGLTANGKVVKPVLKERFKSFNAMFDEIHKTQSTWVVSDEQLQSELRVSISNMVIPAYRSFLGRYSQVFTPGRQTEKYVKYQAEDIETYIDELFDGNAAPAGRKKQ